MRRHSKKMLFAILFTLTLSFNAWGASGTINITDPNPDQVYYTSGNFVIYGAYALTGDNTPAGGCASFWWDSIWALERHANLMSKIDNQPEIIDQYVFRIGIQYEFNIPVNIAGLDPNIEHTVSIYFRDVYATCLPGCNNVYNCGQFTYGGTFAVKQLRFRICRNNDADPFSTCDGDVKTNRCDDNDPTIYPGAPEICDGKDNDCDGVIDEGTDPCCGDPCACMCCDGQGSGGG